MLIRQIMTRDVKTPGHALEDRDRQQLAEIARDLELAGRSKMGEWELIDAIRAAR